MKHMPEKIRYIFEEPRLQMAIGFRMFAEIVFAVMLALWCAATVVALVSEHLLFFWCGVISSVFITLYFIRARRPYKKFFQRGTEEIVNLAEFCDAATLRVCIRAQEKSLLFGGAVDWYVWQECMNDAIIRRACDEMDVEYKKFSRAVDAFLQEPQLRVSRETAHRDLRALMERANAHAEKYGHDDIGIGDVAAAALETGDKELQKLFATHGITKDDFAYTVAFLEFKDEYLRQIHIKRLLYGIRGARSNRPFMTRAWIAPQTPFLDEFSDDLTERARIADGGFLVGRERETARIMEILANAKMPRALLVGGCGVGKNAIVEHLALHLARGAAPAAVLDKRVVRLAMEKICSEGGSPAELATRIEKIFGEAAASRAVILYLQDIDRFLTLQPAVKKIFIEKFSRYIALPGVRAVATIDAEKLRGISAEMQTVMRAFQKIEIDELPFDEVMHMLMRAAAALEARHGISITYSAIKHTIMIAPHCGMNKKLPESAEDLLIAAVTAGISKKQKQITGSDIEEACQLMIDAARELSVGKK